jgi:hypothetical protein
MHVAMMGFTMACWKFMVLGQAGTLRARLD